MNNTQELAVPFDKYSGYTGIKGSATGWFHTEFINGRWWFITPEGNGFVILATNHINNLEWVKWPHAYRDKFGDDFPNSNEAGAYISNQIKSWNFNTAALNPIAPMIDKVPFVHGFHSLVRNSYWQQNGQFSYEDVFDQNFQEKVKNEISEVCKKYCDNPYLIGYAWIDTPRWDMQIARAIRGTDWVSSTRHLMGRSPGKRRYIEYLRSKYSDDIGSVNKIYNLDAISFEHLLTHGFRAAPLDSTQIQQDDMGFLCWIAEELYRLVSQTIKTYDPNHLLLGERFLLRDHPAEILTVAGKYVDVLTFQVGGGFHGRPQTLDDGIYAEKEFNGAFFDELYNNHQKPIYIYDHQCSYPTEEHPETLWYQCKDLTSAVEHYEAFLRSSFEKPYVIGYGRCQYQSIMMRHINKLKQGLIKVDGTVYEEYVNRISPINREVLDELYASTVTNK